MTITARNIGRINVWPTYDIARAADTAECEFIGQLTVWRTADEARANMTHEEEGGSGDGPLIFIDFVNNTAMNNGATVAISTLVGADLNTENAWGTSGYDPAELTANGLVHGSTFPALIGAARTLVVDAATVVIRYKQIVGTALTNSPALALVSEDGNSAFEADLLLTSLNAHHEAALSSWGGSMFVGTANWANIANGAVNVVAVTVTATRAEVALNGGAAVAGTMDEMDRPSDNPLVAAFVDCGGDGQVALQSITIYAALPDTSGLSELSEI